MPVWRSARRAPLTAGSVKRYTNEDWMSVDAMIEDYLQE